MSRAMSTIFDGCQRLLGIAIECPSLRGGHKPPSLPNEQRESELGLEVGDEPADRGLRRI